MFSIQIKNNSFKCTTMIGITIVVITTVVIIWACRLYSIIIKVYSILMKSS